jgi:serine/threonine protein kinase
MSALTVTCAGCGSGVPAGDRFCGTCGNPITGSAILSGEGAAGSFDPWVELLQKLRQATLGEYDIKGELGRGGMAAVFLAHDLHLNRKVAIKVMLPGLVYSERMWERFLQEARTAAKLDHPNIIYIHSVKEKDRFLYFVMKYVDGRPMDDLLSRAGPMPLSMAQSILVEVARALDYAHREGIVHRDIKPANIMIDNKGNSIVMDFGIARVQDSAHFTQTGATIGTPAYMSPEQCHGHDVTSASDQYSLGIVAYEMLCGSQPFKGSPIELQLAHIQETPTHLGELRKDIPADLANAVMRMLEKDPAKRFQTLAQLIPKFGAGLDPLDQTPRDALIEMVKSGPPRRQSFAPTPVSPAPGSLRSQQQFASAVAGSPPPAPAPSTDPADDAVRSAETSAVSSIPLDARSRPTAAIDSGKQEAITFVGEVRDGHAGDTRETPKTKGKAPLWVGAAAVVAISIALAVSKSGSSTPPASAPVDSFAAVAPPLTTANNIEAALGDSVVIGHGPDGTAPVAAKAPKTVEAEAIAQLLVNMGGRTLTVGDTVRPRLSALDDSGERVTSPNIVWATSNPGVVKFAGPGRLVGVRAGRATITVSAASVTGTMNVVVGPRAVAGTRKKAP